MRRNRPRSREKCGQGERHGRLRAQPGPRPCRQLRAARQKLKEARSESVKWPEMSWEGQAEAYPEAAVRKWHFTPTARKSHCRVLSLSMIKFTFHLEQTFK